MRLMLLALAFAPLASASAVEVGVSRKVGVGLVLGEPTGITGKFYLSRDHALDVTLGRGTYDRARDSDLWLHVVYLWHPSVLHHDVDFDLGWHFGVGGYVSERGAVDGAAIGVRAPVGLDFTLTDIPLQFFVDVSADFELLPNELDLWLGLGLGGRYFF